MAPDEILEEALLTVSRWQREKIMPLVATVNWSKSLSSEAGRDTGKDRTFCPEVCGPKGGKIRMFLQMYHDGTLPPFYPVPAKIITFDYWPAGETDSGRATLYGQELYKPGRWFEFLDVEETND